LSKIQQTTKIVISELVAFQGEGRPVKLSEILLGWWGIVNYAHLTFCLLFWLSMGRKESLSTWLDGVGVF